MTENFIIAAFRKMGEEPTTVRLMRNKYTGEPAGYCFVNFATDELAMDAMHKLNGKPIPGTNPIVRFRLNSASNSYKILGNEREFSVWVGDLSSDVDEYQLYKVFSAKYTSIKTAKVILDSSGFSKGYGFVRFGIEEEQKAALYEMNGYVGLGTKPIKICNAVPKPKNELMSANSGGIALGAAAAAAAAAAVVGANGAYGYSSGSTGAAGACVSVGTSTTDYSQYYDSSTASSAAAAAAAATYWQGYNAWQGYYDQGNSAASDMNSAAYYQHSNNPQTLAQSAEAWSAQRAAQYEQQHAAAAAAATAAAAAAVTSNQTEIANDYGLVEYKHPLDVDKLNRESLDADRNLYDALESSKWLPLEQLESY